MLAVPTIELPGQTNAGGGVRGAGRAASARPRVVGEGRGATGAAATVYVVDVAGMTEPLATGDLGGRGRGRGRGGVGRDQTFLAMMGGFRDVSCVTPTIERCEKCHSVSVFPLVGAHETLLRYTLQCIHCVPRYGSAPLYFVNLKYKKRLHNDCVLETIFTITTFA